MTEIITDLWDRAFGLDADGNMILAKKTRAGAQARIATRTFPFQISTAVVAGGGGSNQTKVIITVQDDTGTAIAFPHIMDVFLSDSAVGAGLTATTASGAVAAGAAGGSDFGDFTAKKAKHVQTSAAGIYELDITDSAKTTFFVFVQLRSGEPPLLAAHLAANNYG